MDEGRPRAYDESFVGPALWARIVTSVTGLAEGYDIGCLSGALVLLRRDLQLSSQQTGGLVGVFYFAMAFGAPLGGMLADVLGRKTAMAFTYITLSVGSLIMALAQELLQLLVGRVILGLAVGAGFSIVTTYITEVAPKNHRARYVGLEDLFLVIGIVLGNFFNYALVGLPNDWRLMLGLGAIAPVFALCMLPMIPESPRWLMLHGNTALAEETLRAIVGKEEANRMVEEWGTQTPAVASWSDVLLPRSKWRQRALVAGVCVQIFAMLSGVSVIVAYMGTMFSLEVSDDKAFLLSTAIAGSRLVALACSIFCLVDVVGRKPVLLVSIGGIALSLAFLAYLYHAEAAVIPFKFAAVALFNISFSLGMGPVPFIYTAEVFDNDVRSKSVAFANFLARSVAGILTLLFPYAREAIGFATIFLVLACVNVAGMFFFVFYVPETRAMSLEEMHKIFSPDA